MAEFTVINGILKKCTGCIGAVEIPSGVSEIGMNAFFNSGEMTSVTIPAGVTVIGYGAFSNCKKLASVTISEDVAKIGENAFMFCGSLTSVAVPDSVTDIGPGAFQGCDSLQEITLGRGMFSFNAECFKGRFGWPKQLCRVQFTSELRQLSFSAADNPRLRFYLENGEPCSEAYIFSLLDNDGKRDYLLRHKDFWASLSAGEKAELYWEKQDTAWRDAFPAIIRVEDVQPMAEELEKMLREKGFERICMATARFLISFQVWLPDKTLRSLCLTLMSLKKAARALDMLRDEPVLQQRLDPEKKRLPAEEALLPLLAKDQTSVQTLGVNIREYYGLSIQELPALTDTEGNTLFTYVTAYLLLAHERGRGEKNAAGRYYWKTWDRTGVKPELAPVFALLNADKWQEALRKLLMLPDPALTPGRDPRKYLLYPICRYADETTMQELIKRFPGHSELTERAIVLSDTRAAMMWAEKQGLLTKYAVKHGKSEDELRNAYFSDPGLDERGCHVFDLGRDKIIARLQKDLSYTLEREDGSPVRSLPKKNADPLLYEKAKADLAVLKKETRQIGKSNAETLFSRFLSGQTMPGRDWRTFYPGTPLLARLARLLVWSQQGTTFILGADGKTYGSSGTEYSVTDSPVKVAHPMEMGPTVTARWQEYFLKNGLKQPFEQIWEPVADASRIGIGRYNGCFIPIFKLINKEKDGIFFSRMGSDSALRDCTAEAVFRRAGRGHGASDWIYNEYELRDFRINLFTRQANHIVAILDKVTITGRIQKDDVSVKDRLDLFTLPQILDFIDLAAKSGAVNVSAMLLEYKAEKYGETDIMKEFTLDLI